MNLTHRQLAEMASVSRVTVTKALGQFRLQGWLQRIGDTEILSPEAIILFQDRGVVAVAQVLGAGVDDGGGAVAHARIIATLLPKSIPFFLAPR
jgi:DNA-binding transcriptional MocR family regulator